MERTEWEQSVDESWAWFTKNLGRTPHSADVQHWIDGYVPKDAVIRDYDDADCPDCPGHH